MKFYLLKKNISLAIAIMIALTGILIGNVFAGTQKLDNPEKKGTPPDIEQSEEDAIDLVFHPQYRLQKFDGFGVQAWDEDIVQVEKLIDVLKLKFLRLPVDHVKNMPIKKGTMEEYEKYFAGFIDEDAEKRSLWKMAAKKDVDVILVAFGVPKIWRDSIENFMPTYHKEFVKMWGAIVAQYEKAGMHPRYVELFNEPNGSWDGLVPPADYNKIVKQVRAELDRRGFNNVGIIGPGRAMIEGPDKRIEALDDEGVASMAAWSVHGWEWDKGINRNNGIHHIGRIWPEFKKSVDEKDPGHRRPLFITEYATFATRFHGKSYPSVKNNYEKSASDTIPWAVRVYANTLHFINGGATAVIYWQASDQWWEEAGWGLFRRRKDGSTPRPVYYALKSLSQNIPAGARVFKVPEDDDLVIGGFLTEEQITLAFANGSSSSVQRKIQISGTKKTENIQGYAFVDGQINKKSLEINPKNQTVKIDLPPNSALTLVCDLSQLKIAASCRQTGKTEH